MLGKHCPARAREAHGLIRIRIIALYGTRFSVFVKISEVLVSGRRIYSV